MRCVIETGARFLLNPQLKHEPTLVSPDEAGRVRRIDFLRQAIDLAAAFDAECVSIWSGRIHDGAGDVEAMRRLVMGLTEVLHYAGTKDVLLAFEPEPGMFIDTMASYVKLVEELAAARADTSPLRLTIDVGHLHCQGEVPIARQLHTWRNQLVNIHIEDMRRGVHEHLMFGEGEIDFPPILATLREIEFKGPVSVELSRHAHIGPQAARQAYDFLTATV
jgi:sugar phosphate isomerase/epimerase